MKKLILLSALVLALASCSSTTETKVAAVDSTSCVKADTTCVAKCDSAKVDSVKVK